MIRFIDIRKQATCYRFAFWDTIVEKFCTFDGEQAWESKTDFVQAFAKTGGEDADIERFINLMPEWVDEPMTDDYYDADEGEGGGGDGK